MPENDQIQPGFQPEIQANPQIQQNNLVQSQQQIQEPAQQIIQQDNVETVQQGLQQTTENQVQGTKKRPSRLNKISTWIFFLLGFCSIGFGIHHYFKISYSWWYYDSNSIWNIVLNNGTWAFFLVGIFFIIIGMIKLFHNLKSHTSWSVKIVSRILCFLGFGLIGLGVYSILREASDTAFDTFSIRDIIIYSGIYILWPLGIWFILLGILSYRTENVNIYYHPTQLTKILSGIYRFLGIALVRAGLWNFSLIGTENLSFLKILYVGGVITMCGILYIFLGRLLYNTKSKAHLGFSLLLSLVANIMSYRILKEFSDIGDKIDGNLFFIIITLFSLFYFSVLTIRWIIKCRKFKKKGIINPKYLGSTPSKKKVGIIVTIVLILIVIIDLIYGKIQWSKIPEIDESIFAREEHQVKLPDEEDALVQLRNFFDSYGDKASIINVLDSYYLNGENDDDNKISWKHNTEECIVINSGGNEYCGTWAWDTNTLNRVLNNYYYMGNSDFYKDYYKDYLNDDGYLSVDGEKTTIFKFIEKHESEIKENLQELDRIVSLDYYLPDDEILNLVPIVLQGYSRASMIVLQYYMYQKDWDMVMFIIELNYKIVDIFNDSGSFINQLVGMVIQGVVDSGINSYIQILPKDFRENLSKRYSTQIHDKNEIIEKMIRGEYIVRVWAKNGNIMGEVGKDEPFLFQFIFHFPFYSEKDINKLMDYSYYHIGKFKEDFYGSDIYNAISNNYWSVYNLYGKYPYDSLSPRTISTYDRIDRSIYHKEALIKNLKSGKYDIWFSEKDWNSYEYENNRILTDNELIENLIKEYSDIINPCLGKDTLISNNFSFISETEFGNVCSQVLSKIKEQDDDEFGLKDVLIELTQLWIDYIESLVEQDDCRDKMGGPYGEESYICEEMYNEQDDIVDLMETSYIKLLEILENIENKVKGINIDDYFFIPEMIYDKKNEITNNEHNDINPNDNLNNSDLDNNRINNNELSGFLNKIKEYSDIINPCFGKDIIDPIPDIGIYHDAFEEICLNTLKDLKEQEKDEFGLKDILIEITKSLINYGKFEIKVDACWLEEGTVPHLCDEIFDKEEELINNIKENYIKLSNILENIENENPGVNINNYFYIPREKIYDKNNMMIVGFFIDEEKSKEILNNIKLQESTNNN